MPQQLSKAQFAQLVLSMPEATDEEILKAAAQKAQDLYGGAKDIASGLWNHPADTISGFFQGAKTPAVDAAKGLGDAALGFGQMITTPPSQQAQALAMKAATATSLPSAGDVMQTVTGIDPHASFARKSGQALGGLLLAHGLAGGEGLPTAIEDGSLKGQPVQKVAEAYNQSVGLPVEQAAAHTPVKVNPEEAKAIADAYQAMPHNPNDPAVKASYDALKNQVENQFDFITNKAGMKMEPWTGEGQPYANSKEMMNDVQKNSHLFYFPTDQGYGAEGSAVSDHPLMQTSPKFGVPYNDLFRAVHDYFGHAKEGFQFGPQGEENAWLSHQGTLSDEAIPALTSETRGQNSWVNFGQHLRDAEGNLPSKGQPGFVAPAARPFAEQKAGLLPPEFLQRADALPSSGEPAAAPSSPQAEGRVGDEATSPSSVSPSSESQGVSSQPSYSLNDAASIVHDLTSQKGGATFNLYKGDLIGTPHYAVATYPERGVILDGKASPGDISSFVQKNADLLKDPENSIGTWFNEGKTYLDVSKTVPDIQQAMKMGKDAGQKAIYNLQNFDEIPVDQPNVRLYRGESGASQPGALAGQTFTDDPMAAVYYAKQGGGAGKTYYIDLPQSVASQFKTPDATGQGVHVLPPELAQQARNNVLGAGSEGQSIIKPKEPEAAPQLPAEFTAVGSEPPYKAPQFNDPIQAIQDKIAAAGGRDQGRVAKEQAARGINPTTAAAIAAPVAAAALPDDDQHPLAKYGRLGIDLAGAAGLMAGVRGRQSPMLTGEMDAASKGAAGLWLNGQKGFEEAVGPEYANNPKIQKAADKLINQHLKTTMNNLPNLKKLLALNQTGLADAKWYDSTAQELQQAFGADAPLVAKLFAATSNNSTVSSNAAMTIKALKQIKFGQPIEGYLPAVIENIKRAAAGQPLNGRKIDNFAQALSGDPNAVVVDRWVMRAFGFSKGTAPTDNQYDFMENAIRQLAQQTGQTPSQVQAAIWFAQKNAAEVGKNRPPSPPPQQALQDAIGRLQTKAGVENRKFDKAKAAGAPLPF